MENSNRTKKTVVIAGVFILALIMAMVAIADGPPKTPGNIGTDTISRRNNFAATATAVAYAGNVSQLDINHEELTQFWQGYYGTVSGAIVLDDAYNQSLYAWELITQGEVFATMNATTPLWNNLTCMNDTLVLSEESRLQDGAYDDNITETFNVTNNHPPFNVSNTHFPADTCNYSLWTYESDAYPTSPSFNETVLWDTSADRDFAIYTAFINNDVTGFNGSDWDFQMIVPEYGRNSDVTESTYYFYVELQ